MSILSLTNITIDKSYLSYETARMFVHLLILVLHVLKLYNELEMFSPKYYPILSYVYFI